MKLIEQIVEALSATKKVMHVDDIAKAIITKYPNTHCQANFSASRDLRVPSGQGVGPDS